MIVKGKHYVTVAGLKDLHINDRIIDSYGARGTVTHIGIFGATVAARAGSGCTWAIYPDDEEIGFVKCAK